MYKNEHGSFTIETTICLTLFMAAFIALISLAMIAKVESTTQYAIDQTAKEIAQYYYVADKMGIANTDSGGVKEIDDTVQSLMDFTDKSKTAINKHKGKSVSDLYDTLKNYKDVANDVTEITKAANGVYGNFKTLFDDPKEILKALTTSMAKEIGNEIVTKIIAQPICRTLVPKYITSTGDADQTLRSMGVVNGLDGLDFRMSSFLTDQRSINIVVVYRIKVLGFGYFNSELVIKQTASTAAWVKGVSLAQANKNVSTWSKGNLERGKEFVSVIKSENKDKAVKSGKGVDLYDKESNTYKSVISVNVFSASYSDFSQKTKNGAQEQNYTIKKDAVKSVIRKQANNLKDSTDKVNDSLKMDSGSTLSVPSKSEKKRNNEIIVVMPSEVNTTNGNLATVNEIAKEIEQETGVKVTITYREKALGGSK